MLIELKNSVGNAPGVLCHVAIVVGTSLVLALSLGPAIAGESSPRQVPDKDDAGTLPARVSEDWLSEVQQQIRRAEYEITWQSETKLRDVQAAWHAPNRAHDFRTYFTGDGIRVVPRAEEEPSWKWGLTLVGYGRGQSVWPVEPAILMPDGNRMDYGRGELVEWYVNDRTGLEQGFTLSLPPEEASAGHGGANAASLPGARSPARANVEREPAYVVLALRGSLSALLSTDGQSIDFVAPSGACAVRYGELKVRDAAGRDLDAWMEAFNDAGARGIRLVFDETAAVYPITIDPLATSPAWTDEGDQANSKFGFSVSTAGDVNGDGYADVVVGAYGYDNGETDEGRALVYHGSRSGLSRDAAWMAESNQASAGLGRSVSTAGDVNGDGYADVVVGAPWYSNVQADEGWVFAFYGSAGGLDHDDGGSSCPADADWCTESDHTDAYFGIAASTAGDVNGDGYVDVIVGAYGYDNGQTDEGRAFVFHGSAGGLDHDGGGSGCPADADWCKESNHADAHFGWSVSTAGDVNGDGYADVIIGAKEFDSDYIDEGRAFVYQGSPSGLSGSAAWTGDSDGDGFTEYGYSVSTAGDVNGDGYADVIVGAPYYAPDVLNNEGGAFVYHGSASGLSKNARWTEEGDRGTAYFGISVSAGDVNGDGYADVIVGASAYGVGGRALVYHGSASGLSEDPAWAEANDQAGAAFGVSVSTAGDVNGDGYADVIVGASLYDDEEPNEGRALVYHGSASGLSPNAAWTETSDPADARFGWSVSTAGDVNGDGYADVIVGADEFDSGQTDEGCAFVFHGTAGGLDHDDGGSGCPADADWCVESDEEDAHFGVSVSTAGDVNGDGYADVIVGADEADAGQVDEGRAFVYYGAAGGLDHDGGGSGCAAGADWCAESDQADAGFGTSVSSAGDVNGDGYADAIVGADRFDAGQTDEGQAFVFFGAATGLDHDDGGSGCPADADWCSESDQAHAGFGISVSTAGDVNGDGYADVIVGAHGFDGGEAGEGRVFVYDGSPSGLSSDAAWTAESDQAGASFGRCVSTAGDVNGDGYADVIVGAWRYDRLFTGKPTDEGRAYVYHGSSSGLSSIPGWTAESRQVGAHFARSVAGAGDVNGDGYADVIVGACHFDNGQTDEGRAYVYHGSSSGLSPAPGWTAESNDAYAEFGRSVSAAGDVNGDGYADVIVGAGPDDSAFVYFGNEGAGVSLGPQQRRADDSAPIAPLGLSDQADSFRLALLGRTPFGRGKVKLEWEVEPLGRPFDGQGTGVSAAWIDTDVAGVQLNELVDGLDGAVYHWRARVLYHPATTPLQHAGPWITVPWNGRQEADLRTATGDTLCIDDDGDGYGTWDCLSGPDCDDGNADTYPEAPEICDREDNDCDRVVPTEERDLDGDGLTPCEGDCDDSNDRCTTDCRDADADGYCVTTDCDDYHGECQADCSTQTCVASRIEPVVAVISDVNDNNASELAVVHTDLPTGVHSAYVKDAGTGDPICDRATFTVDFDVIGVVSVPDFSGNGADEFAVAGRRQVDGRVSVRVYDALTCDYLTDLPFSATYTPRGIATVPHFDGSAAAEIAVLGVNASTGRVLVRIKDASTGETLRDVFYPSNYDPLKMVVIPSFDGTSAAEIGVLATDPVTDRVRIRVKDASSGVKLRDVFFSKKHRPRDVIVVPSYGGTAADELALLGVEDETSRVMIRVKDASSGAKLDDIFYSKVYVAATCLGIGDFGGSPASELGVVGVHEGTGQVLIRSKDADSRVTVSDIVFSRSYPPKAVVVIPSFGGTSADEYGLLGRHTAEGNLLLRVKDADTGTTLTTIPIPN